MEQHQYNWITADGVKLFAQSWLPAHQPKAVICYVHGFKDHSSRFEKWAARFTQHQYGVLAFDLRGHGRSEGRRGCAPSFSNFLADTSLLIQKCHALFPGIPVILYGHSFGGNIVANYLTTHEPMPLAAVIASPWFTLRNKPNDLQLMMAKIARYVLPWLTVASDLNAEGLSRDESVARAYLLDPLVHNAIQPRLFFEIEENGKKASRSIYKINIPILVMHGTADPITSFKVTAEFVRNAGYHTTFREWPGAFHELHNETNETEVFAFVHQWLNSITGN